MDKDPPLADPDAFDSLAEVNSQELHCWQEPSDLSHHLLSPRQISRELKSKVSGQDPIQSGKIFTSVKQLLTGS